MTSAAAGKPKYPELISRYEDLEREALTQAQQASTISDRVSAAEVLRNLAEARNAAEESRGKRVQQLAATLIPLCALVVTAATLLVQNHQFHNTLISQSSQFEESQRSQREANLDAQWREALKSVSFRDPHAAVVGAYTMQGFFNIPKYDSQARAIASTLLVGIQNVGAFDSVLTAMRDRTTSANMVDMTIVAQMLGYEQRKEHGIIGAASKGRTPFLIEVIDEVDPNPADIEKAPDERLKIAAWKIDSASQFLRQLWVDKNKHLSPVGLTLTGVVLENAHDQNHTFDGVDFSKSDLRFGILANASFRKAKFDGANIENLYVTGVALDEAEFKGVTAFDGSRWEDANWWDAKCIPGPMLSYLAKHSNHVLTAKDKTRLQQGCLP